MNRFVAVLLLDKPIHATCGDTRVSADVGTIGEHYE
jgi:hypothetical protein